MCPMLVTRRKLIDVSSSQSSTGNSIELVSAATTTVKSTIRPAVLLEETCIPDGYV
jgi:hypothetical protein